MPFISSIGYESRSGDGDLNQVAACPTDGEIPECFRGGVVQIVDVAIEPVVVSFEIKDRSTTLVGLSRSAGLVPGLDSGSSAQTAQCR
jgi:hypothetical protein